MKFGKNQNKQQYHLAMDSLAAWSKSTYLFCPCLCIVGFMCMPSFPGKSQVHAFPSIHLFLLKLTSNNELCNHNGIHILTRTYYYKSGVLQTCKHL